MRRDTAGLMGRRYHSMSWVGRLPSTMRHSQPVATSKSPSPDVEEITPSSTTFSEPAVTCRWVAGGMSCSIRTSGGDTSAGTMVMIREASPRSGLIPPTLTVNSQRWSGARMPGLMFRIPEPAARFIARIAAVWSSLLSVRQSSPSSPPYSCQVQRNVSTGPSVCVQHRFVSVTAERLGTDRQYRQRFQFSHWVFLLVLFALALFLLGIPKGTSVQAQQGQPDVSQGRCEEAAVGRTAAVGATSRSMDCVASRMSRWFVETELGTDARMA